MSAVRLLVVDDHTLFRQGLVGLLQNEPLVQVSGQAANGEQALDLVQRLPIDVVLLDVQLPGESGTAVARRLLEAQPGLRIIMLTVVEDNREVLEAIAAGARGYLLKNTEADELMRAIARVHAGEAVLAPAITLGVLEAVRSATVPPSWAERLTLRELDVLQLLVQGTANRQISETLSISENTVKTHVAHILAKLELDSRGQLIGRARLPASHGHGLGQL